MRKKRFRFEKWWTKKADFQEVVSKAWGGEGGGGRKEPNFRVAR
jgi:hypothetical protein